MEEKTRIRSIPELQAAAFQPRNGISHIVHLNQESQPKEVLEYGKYLLQTHT
jgi:hypothetical protein